MTDFFKKFLSTFDNSLYSTMVMELYFPFLNPANLLNNEFFNKKYKSICLNSIYNVNSQIKHLEAVFKVNGTNFFIYLKEKNDENDKLVYEVTIIFMAEQYEEIKLYINGLKKIK